MNIETYWHAVLKQEKERMSTFFQEDAVIRWHNTNEQFTVNEFIQANCEYPGIWNGNIMRIEKSGDLIITAVHVYEVNKLFSFHVVSFIQLANDKIIAIDEYWGDDGEVPAWRLEKQIGKAIIK